MKRNIVYSNRKLKATANFCNVIEFKFEMVCVKSPHTTTLRMHPGSWKKIGRKYTRTKQNRKRKMNVTFGSQQHVVISHEDSTWLSPQECRSIRREIELTIVLLDQLPGGDKNLLPSRFCSRGLEDFCYAQNISTRTMATCLKPEVLLRRRKVINSVLDQQELMRRRRHVWKGVDHRDGNDTSQRASTFRINHENTMKAIERGLNDAQQARMIYQEWLE